MCGVPAVERFGGTAGVDLCLRLLLPSTLIFPWLHSLSSRASYSRTIVQLPLQFKQYASTAAAFTVAYWKVHLCVCVFSYNHRMCISYCQTEISLLFKPVRMYICVCQMINTEVSYTVTVFNISTPAKCTQNRSNLTYPKFKLSGDSPEERHSTTKQAATKAVFCFFTSVLQKKGPFKPV